MTPAEWLRRQRPSLAPGVEPPITLGRQPVSAPQFQEVAEAELAALREKVSRLTAELAVQTVRAADAELALSNQNTLLDHKDQVIAALRLEVAELGDNHGAACGDTASSQRWRRVAHALQERVVQLQRANEAHDRYRAATAVRSR